LYTHRMCVIHTALALTSISASEGGRFHLIQSVFLDLKLATKAGKRMKRSNGKPLLFLPYGFLPFNV
jgi:hypothetical protein